MRYSTYTLFTDDDYDKILAYLCFAYCEGKPFIWKMFFGWRETHVKFWRFKLPWKTFSDLKKTARELHDDLFKGEN